MANSRKPARNKTPGAKARDGFGSVDAVASAICGALERNAARDAALCVALSGGVDSVVLLHALRAQAARHGLRLSALHVNHGISLNARTWETFCRALCLRLHVPLKVRRVRITRDGRGLESAAREARYQALGGSRARFVALAHQLDDQAETVLFNLLRGAGLAGASGMAECGRLHGSPDSKVLALRPLLSIAREEIEAYARQHELDWVEDESNADEMLTRNWVRRRVGPMLAARFPRWREALSRAASHFAEAQSLLRPAAAQQLDVETLRSVSKAQGKLLLREYLHAAGVKPPAARRLEEMLRQFIDSQPDAAVEFLHDGHAVRSYRGRLAVLPAFGAHGEVLLHACTGTGIDAAKLNAAPVSVRTRQGGERLRLAPNRPSRSLKNLFQEAGIPPWEREALPLLYSGEELVWVPGVGVAADFRAARGRAGLRPEWRRNGKDSPQAIVFTKAPAGSC